MAVLLRRFTIGFMGVLLRRVARAVLLRRVTRAVLLRGVTRVVNAQSEHLFYKRALVQKQPTQVRGNTWFRTRVWVRRKKELED